MKIAIVSPWTIKQNSIGGTERFVIDLAESFKKSGHAVDVYMLSGDSYVNNGVNYLNIDLFAGVNGVDEFFLKEYFQNFNEESSFEKLANEIERKISFSDYDLVQLNSQLFLKLAQSQKRIFTIHTNPFEYKLDWGEKSFDLMLNVMNQQSKVDGTYFVAPSLYYAKIYNELSDVDVKFLPHAIDVSRLNCEKEKELILASLGIDFKKKIILLPSRLEPIQKQPMLFMKAFALLDNKVKNKFKVICTGADKQYEQYKDEILNFCKENNIDILITRFDTMREGYKVADVVALPSQSESFGYSALESLSLGILTILNNIPTYSEIIRGAKNYYQFDNDVETLHQVLVKVLDGDFERCEQTKEWNDRYSIELFCNRYLSLVKIDD